MNYRVLIFEPKKSNFENVILWKAQMFPPSGYESVGVTLLNDNIEVNNRRTFQEWESLLTDNGFKYEVNYDHEYCKEYIIFDTACVAFSFQIFACDINASEYAVEISEEFILSILYILNIKKDGLIFPNALLSKIQEAYNIIDHNKERNIKTFKNILTSLRHLAEECQLYETDVKFHIVER